MASLRTAITSGQIPPQTQMVETELSEQLQISRGTLREAMRQLQQEGLLTAGSRGRLYVRRLGPKEITDIFAVRASLEGLATSTLARRDDRSAVADRAPRVCSAPWPMPRRTWTSRAGSSPTSPSTAPCASEPATRSLLHTWQGLEGSIRMSIMFAGTDRALGNMDVSRHDAIVEAIASGDSQRAVAAVEEHMSWAAANLTG